MKPVLIAALLAGLITGCGKTESTDPIPTNPQPDAAPTQPTNQTPPAAATNAAKRPANIPAPPPPPPMPTQITPAGTSGTIQQMTAQLANSAPVKSDPLLAEITGDIGQSAKTLSDALPANDSSKTQVRTMVQALANGKDTEAIATYQKLANAKLTPEQSKIVTEIKDAVSAFVVQKNFSTLSGAETQVTQIVQALRKGDAPTALQSLQQVAANAELTPEQKSLVTSLVDQYAPALKDAGQAIENLKGLNPLEKP